MIPSSDRPANDTHEEEGPASREAGPPGLQAASPPLRDFVSSEELLTHLTKELNALYRERGLPIHLVAEALAPFRAAVPPLEELGKFASALVSTVRRGGMLDGLPALCLQVAELVRLPSDVSSEAIERILEAQRSLFSGELAISPGRPHFPQVVAIALSRPQLRDVPHGEPVTLLAEILSRIPIDGQHRSLRDLLMLLDTNVQIEDLRVLRDLVMREEGPAGAATAFRIFCGAYTKLRPTTPSAWVECRALVTDAMDAGFRGARVLIRCFEELSASGVLPTVRQTFCRAMPLLAREEPTKLHAREAAAAVRSWISSPPSEQACLNFLNGLTLSHNEGVAARFARLTGSCFERIPFDEAFWPALEELCGVSHQPIRAPERHETQRRLADLHRGFAQSLRFDVTRLPGETVSPLLRLGLEFGDVQLVHAVEPGGFPGGGILLNNLDVDRLLIPDQARPTDRFHVYKSSWRSCAQEIQDIPRITVIVCKGMFIIQPPVEVTLSLLRKEPRHYSLALFDDHLHNESLVRALLVDSAWLRRRVAPCLKDFNPNWTEGQSEDSAKDINSMGLRPQDILAANTSRDVIAIDISSPLSHLAGFQYGLAPGTPPIFGHSEEYPESAPLTVFGHINNAAVSLPRARLNQIFSHHARLDAQISAYVRRVLNYADTFRLCNSLAHKGLVGATGIGEDFRIRLPGAAVRTRPELGFIERGIATTGPSASALRTLVDAVKLHRALKSGSSHPHDTDPILISAATLSYSQPPDGDFSLDVRSLECRMDTLPFNLFEGRRSDITREVKRRWIEKVLPRLSDPYQDLRFVPRSFVRRFSPRASARD